MSISALADRISIPKTRSKAEPAEVRFIKETNGFYAFSFNNLPYFIISLNADRGRGWDHVHIFGCPVYGLRLHKYLEPTHMQIYNSERQSYSNAFCKKEHVYG